MNIEELKQNIASSLQQWISDRIDTLVSEHPRLKVASVYLKRGATNYMKRESDKISEMIDKASIFLCDESGNVDTDTLFEDAIKMFRDMDEVPFGNGILCGTIGKGKIRFALPDNAVTNLFFGDTGAINITDTDLIELKKIVSENI